MTPQIWDLPLVLRLAARKHHAQKGETTPQGGITWSLWRPATQDASVIAGAQGCLAKSSSETKSQFESSRPPVKLGARCRNLPWSVIWSRMSLGCTFRANEAAFLSALTVPLLTWTNVAFLVRPNRVQIRKGGRSGSSCHVRSLEMPALGTLVALAKKEWKSWKFDGELEIREIQSGLHRGRCKGRCMSRCTRCTWNVLRFSMCIARCKWSIQFIKNSLTSF